MSTKKKKQTHRKSRYQRVQEILTQAAGDSTADYEGFGPFWKLPYVDFLAFRMYNIDLLVPASSSSSPVQAESASSESGGCCSSSANAGSATGEAQGSGGTRGCGAESGLVKGLRGEFPFDGTQFPRLPWGGEAVSDADIRFIESWIDDDCPETDDAAKPDQPVPKPQPAPWRHLCPPDPRVGVSANTFHHEHGQPKMRKNYEYLSEEELCKLRYAVRVLKKLDQYPNDDRSFSSWARIHGDHCQHGWEQFLTWHRAYLYKFELALQGIVPDVTLPYWDWTMKIYQVGAVPKGRQSGVVPTALRCWLSDQALENLRNDSDLTRAVFSKLKKVEGQLFNSAWELFRQAGLTATDYKTYSRPVVDQLKEVNPLWHPYRYPGMFYQTDDAGKQKFDASGNPILSNAHLHYPRAEDIEQILGITHWHDFGGGHEDHQSAGTLEQQPHNTGHIWSGGKNPFWSIKTSSNPEPTYGDMADDLRAFFDPIGYAHHSNIDRVFQQWQTLHPGLTPSDPTSELVPFSLRVQEVLDVTKLGYEYARDSRMWRTDSSQEITRHSTDKAGLADGTLQGHGRVELRLYNLRRSVGSHTVRVFLNQPGADASTPTTGNDHYVGYFARFGHGNCIGGPGHCDPPGTPVSRFEMQPRHHNSPHNHRLDATECVARLVAAGESDFSVSLVVVDGNGGATEGLKMDGISVHVID